jgi:hypothetical protein
MRSAILVAATFLACGIVIVALLSAGMLRATPRRP